jgi:hypothetical protein
VGRQQRRSRRRRRKRSGPFGEPDYGRICPALQKFYGGDPQAWFETPAWIIRTYQEALEQLRAREQLALIEAFSVPYMSKEQHRDVIGRLTAELGISRRAQPATAADLAALGITVEHVPPEEVTPDE